MLGVSHWKPLLAVALSLGAVTAPLASAAGSFEIKDGKLSVSTLDGSSRLSKAFTSSTPVDIPQPLSLDADEILRVVFSVEGDSVASSSEEGTPKRELPHQVFAVLSDDDKPGVQETQIVPIKKSTGKGSFTIRLDRLPSQLLTSSGKLSLSLLIGSFSSSSPINYRLTSVQLPSAILRTPEQLPSPRQVQAKEQGFFGWEERRHTFATPASETMPPKFLSLSIAVATVALPWVVLLAFIGALPLQLSPITSKKGLLLGTLIYLELLASRYWLGGPSMTLFNMLPWLFAGGVAALLTGRGALGELRKERLAAPSAAAEANSSS